MNEGTRVSCDEYWANGWRGRTIFRFSAGRLHPLAERAGAERDGLANPTARRVHIPGTVFAHLTDHHVHLGLVDGSSLVSNGITDVTDLGWIPAVASDWRESSSPGLPETRIAGAFLTCAGGYPSASTWAPAGAVREVATPAEASPAVDDQAHAGASVIKVVLNSVAGPVLDDETLGAIVEAAHGRDLPVVIHVEGAGQAVRAAIAGADALAHTPFSERLDDELLTRMAGAGLYWISTLDIHGWGEPTAEFDIAQDNLRRFAAVGGRIRYGTDLGNGPLPRGVNARELASLAAAGLDRDALLRTIAGSHEPASIARRLAWVPGLPPASAAETADWLGAAQGSTLETLEDALA